MSIAFVGCGSYFTGSTDNHVYSNVKRVCIIEITLLRMIPTLTHYSDIVSDIPSGSIHGIYIYSEILPGILSGIYSDILSDIELRSGSAH